MAELAEVFFAKAKEGGAVEFGVAADVIVCVRVKLFAVAVAPRLTGLIAAFQIDDARIPVVFLAGHIAAALKNQDALAGSGKLVGERAAAGSRTNDDYIV